MLRDMAGVTAATHLAVEYIMLTGYSHFNAMLPQQDRLSVTPTTGPALGLDIIRSLVDSGLLYATFVYNHSGSSITSIARNGIRQVHQPVLGRYNGEIILRQVVIVQKEITPKLDKYFYNRNCSENFQQEFKVIKDAYIEYRNNPYQTHLCLIIDAVVHEQELEHHRSIYVNNRDIVISLEEVDEAPPHPFDSLESSIEACESMLNGQIGCGILYDLIDNKKQHGHHFMLSGKLPILVPARQDPGKEDGVHIYRTHLKNGERIIETEHLSFEEAKTQIGLYDSYEKALHGGDVEVRRAMELETLKHSNKVANEQFEQFKTDREREILSLKSSQTERELSLKESITRLERDNQELQYQNKSQLSQFENEKLQLQRQYDYQKFNIGAAEMYRKNHYDDIDYRRKDYYEGRTHERKDFTESVKFWPVLLAGAIGAFAYFNK